MLILLVKSLSISGQGLEIFAKKINLPKDIKLDLPIEADFYDIYSENYIVTYSIENTHEDTLIDLNDGRLYDPKLVSRKERYSKGVDIYTSENEFEASYIAKASSKQYAFNFIEWGESIRTGDFLGIKDTIVNIPDSWKDSLKGKKIINIWFICYARIDSRGFPLEKRDFFEPIFIQTEEGMFGVKKSYKSKENRSNPYIAPSYSGFILQNCNFNKLELNNFNEAVKNRIVEKLKVPPFSAIVYSDFSLPEDEIWLKREYKNSLVLGNPYFEISNYILRWKIYDYPDQNGVKFYITQSLTKSVGLNGTYSEPNISEFKKYQERINVIVSTAVKEVCTQYHLTYSNNHCKCN